MEKAPGTSKTSAWPLGAAFAALIAYASLYPFTAWRDQGLPVWEFLAAPLPRYWTGFDVTANVFGYMPLGFLLAVALLRSRRAAVQDDRTLAVLGATGMAALLSLSLESLQFFLPRRIPSNVDLALNVAGGLAGALLAALAHRLGAVERWSRFRARWFVDPARGALVLLALWPAALLYPASVPFGLGQVMERLESAAADLLTGTPFLDWLPVRDTELQPLAPSAEMLVTTLGLLVPVLLAFSIVRAWRQRLLVTVAVVAAGLGATALSSALSYGPGHAWAWVGAPVQAGVGGALLAAVLLSWVPPRGCVALVLLALGVGLGLLNQAPADQYFVQTLQDWEQGRFIRFHGVGQWLSWLWPYAAIVYLLLRLSSGQRLSRIAP